MKPIIGLEEEITILDSTGTAHSLLAKIDTGAYRTSIDQEVAKQIGIHTPIIYEKTYRSSLGRESRPVINATFMIQNRTISTEVSMTDRSKLNYKIIIGRRDLRDFLIDPSKTGEILSSH